MKCEIRKSRLRSVINEVNQMKKPIVTFLVRKPDTLGGRGGLCSGNWGAA